VYTSIPNIDLIVTAFQADQPTDEMLESLKASGINATNNSDLGKNNARLTTLTSDLTKAIVSLNDISGPFAKQLSQFRDELERSVNELTARVIQISVILLTLVTILAYASIIFITGRIVTRVSRIKAGTGKIAEKDLTISIFDASSDEVGELSRNLENTIENLNGFMIAVKATADEAARMSEAINQSAGDVTAATTEISANMGSLDHQFGNLEKAVSTSTQALETMSSSLVTFMTDIAGQNDAITESARSITEMNQSITLISGKSREKAKQVKELKEVAAEGGQQINNTEMLLAGITSQLDSVNGFIEIINNIAEQTSILSMNASIESAHAGEAGKGFAVVADEIQKLAESTTENAQLINTTLLEIIEKVQEARSTSQVATKAFLDTTGTIEELSGVLTEIVTAITSIDERSAKAATHADFVTKSTKELSQKTGRLDSVRQSLIGEMRNMDAIFTEARGGISEINVGAGDILARIKKIHDLSSLSREKMTKLDQQLNQFATKDIPSTPAGSDGADAASGTEETLEAAETSNREA
jgi:methyl-accepting chemotaxis protein